MFGPTWCRAGRAEFLVSTGSANLPRPAMAGALFGRETECRGKMMAILQCFSGRAHADVIRRQPGGTGSARSDEVPRTRHDSAEDDRLEAWIAYSRQARDYSPWL